MDKHTIKRAPSNDTVSVMDSKGKAKVGLEDKNQEKGPREGRTAQRLLLNHDKVVARNKVQMTSCRGEGNGLKLSNQFSALDCEAS